MHTVFQLYDILSFVSTVVINALIIISPKGKQANILKFWRIESMNMLLG